MTLTAGLVALVAAPITALADGIQISDSLWGEDKPVASTPPPGVPSAGLTSPASAPLGMLPIETDENGTVDRCVKVSGTGAPKPGDALVVGVHLRLDESKLKNPKTYFPSRVIILNPGVGQPWQARPDLAVGPVGSDTSSYDIFLGTIPEEQARILQNDLSATKPHTREEMDSRQIEIIPPTTTVSRRPSQANWCN